jgi:DNA-directed RNA polymerase subunit RPC12/RpoP
MRKRFAAFVSLRDLNFYTMEFVLLNAYTNYIEAHIAKGMLEEQGINCWLKDENTVTLDPILTNAVGGIKIMVAKPDAEKAREILSTLKKEQQLSVTCPQCGSHNIETVSTPRKASNWLSAITTFFLGNYAIAPDKVYHCFDCKHEFPLEEKEIAV